MAQGPHQDFEIRQAVGTKIFFENILYFSSYVYFPAEEKMKNRTIDLCDDLMDNLTKEQWKLCYNTLKQINIIHAK